MRRMLLLLFFLLLAIPASAQAHQPRLVGSQTSVKVFDPETSKAFYGRLRGQPATYTIQSSKPFDLYVQITLPDIKSIHKDWLVQIKKPDASKTISLPQTKWSKFWEPFGGDKYLLGGEWQQQVPAGTYKIKVSRPGNQGVYVLVIGQAENFGPVDMWQAFVDVPRIKHNYFDDSHSTVDIDAAGKHTTC